MGEGLLIQESSLLHTIKQTIQRERLRESDIYYICYRRQTFPDGHTEYSMTIQMISKNVYENTLTIKSCQDSIIHRLHNTLT